MLRDIGKIEKLIEEAYSDNPIVNNLIVNKTYEPHTLG